MSSGKIYLRTNSNVSYIEFSS